MGGQFIGRKIVEPGAKILQGVHDAVKIDFVGSVDGTEFQGGAAQDYVLELGSNSLIPGFEDQLVGIGPGETREVNVTFPAEYGAKELAGKDAVFKVTCKEVLAFVDRPIDDALAKSTGFETLDAMRKQVAERIGQDYQQLSRNMIKTSIRS